MAYIVIGTEFISFGRVVVDCGDDMQQCRSCRHKKCNQAILHIAEGTCLGSGIKGPFDRFSFVNVNGDTSRGTMVSVALDFASYTYEGGLFVPLGEFTVDVMKLQ